VHLDVTNPEQWTAAAAAAAEEFGKLNVLVNNAGIINDGPLKTFDLTKWQQILDVNVTGTLLGIQAAIDPMTACAVPRGCTGT